MIRLILLSRRKRRMRVIKYLPRAGLGVGRMVGFGECGVVIDGSEIKASLRSY